MSTIGRIFVVLNLVLAGFFVGFAGTFLQQHTDWKQKHDDLNTVANQSKQELQDQVTSLQSEKRTAVRELGSYKDQLAAANGSIEKLNSTNTQLRGQMADYGQKLGVLSSSSGTVASQIEQAVADAKAAMSKAMEATASKDQASQAKDVAERELADAKTKIVALTQTIASREGKIASLDQEVRENKALIAVVQTRAPGLLAMAQPTLGGSVIQVGANGRIMTVEVRSNPGNVAIATGYRFAIYRGAAYKGEAVVTGTDSNFAFCRVTKLKDGQTVQVGDNASTNLDN